MQSSLAAPSISDIESDNSSDEIMKKVEEEIANARKAAKEATRKLAGVSKNYISDSTDSPHSAEKSNLDQMMPVDSNYSSSSNDDDNHFDSALKLIGNEFDEIVQASSGSSSFMSEEKNEDDSVDEESPRNREEFNPPKSPVANVNNRWIDDTYLYEVEEVMSDEREMDRMAMQTKERKTEQRDQDSYSIDRHRDELESQEGDQKSYESSFSPENRNDSVDVTGRPKIQQRDDAEATKAIEPVPNSSPIKDRLLSVFYSRKSPPTTPKTQNIGDSDSYMSTLFSRKRRVTFKQRYPIPQKMNDLREPSEILRNNQVEKETHNLWLSMPKPELQKLLDAITGTSIHRRSNACGALKVMSNQKKNQLTLVRTKGFMDAIVFAIKDNYSIEDADARVRAVSVVLSVSARKDNRYHVLIHPGLRESLIKCLTGGDPESKELACAVFATLAKSQHCREPMGKTENLLDALATILKKEEARKIEPILEEDRTDDSGDDDRSRHISNTFSSSDLSTRSESTVSSYGVESTESERTQDSEEESGEDLERKRRTRMNTCAVLMHLSKECSVSQELCANDNLLSSLISCCREVENPMHTKCMEILANLTRFPHNNARLVQFPGLIEALLLNGAHEDDFDRLWSMRTLQNLSSDPSAKTILSSSSVLELLCTNMMGRGYEEQLAALSALYNISTEPGAVVPLTNTKNVVATLVHVAHNPSSMMEVRTIACDTLSTIGLWLQTLSSAGTVPQGVKAVPLPSYVATGWQRCDE